MVKKKNKKSKRDRLVDAAAELFHHNGPMMTSLADIAAQAKIPIGNVYYYFKTKEELVLAVIEKRRYVLRQAYDALNEAFTDPRQRLTEALGFFENIKDDYTAYGCPLGRLIVELGEESLEAKGKTASVLDEFVSWSAEQFSALGHEENATRYAVTLMAGVEGAAVMAKSYGNADVFSYEMKRLISWVEDIPNNNLPMGKFSRGKAA